MKKNYFFRACFISFLITLFVAGLTKSDCLEKEKTLALLETAEDLLSKAKGSFPSCNEDLNSTNLSECSGKKPLAYIEISKKLISDIRENFPKCPKVEQYDKNIDCSEILSSGYGESGVYTIWPWEPFRTRKPLQVYCDMETDGGGWTVVQRRGKFPVQQDFYQDWESYKHGFGNITQEFWLGNENIRVLCHNECEIRFDLQDKDGKKGYAVYKNFTLLGGNYTISISGYMGDAGDCMQFHRNKSFSTKDKGDVGRAQKLKGGWWYEHLNNCNLNGIYQPGKSSHESAHWWMWRNTYDSLSGVEIKVRPK